jgi:ABC-type lipoprotein export system ATPase subunit
LTCEYAQGVPALQVDDLDIHAGELTFVVGASGSGKSTLLEAIGLMTQTARTNSNFSYILDAKENERVLELAAFWEWDASQRSDIRSRFFSFIFQQENMFSSLNAMENMVLPAIMTSSDQEKQVREDVKMMSKKLLPGVELSKPIMAYSGGQRQRFAFIRALAKPHTVLLADEPTGNLDQLRAEEAMEMTKALVNEKATAAVIVSHDISLAIKSADRIILIDKPLNAAGLPSAGIIEAVNIFSRSKKGWKSSSMTKTDSELQSTIVESLQSLNLK